MNTNTIMEELSNFIFTSKYARFNEKLKRRETWNEAVERLFSMHFNKFKKKLSSDDMDQLSWAFSLVADKRVVPSMRSLQFGGKAIEKKNERIYNCLGVETEFITNKGVKRFSDFKNGDSIVVLTHTGSWKKAVVKNYGKDYLYPVKVQRVKSEKTIYATRNHTWFLKDGSKTENLKQRDQLRGSEDIFNKFDYNEAPPEEKLYWAYGYVYGDGTLLKDKHGEYRWSMVRLCDNERRLAYRFEELGFSTSSPLSCKGDFMAYTGSYLKTAPNPEVDSPELIRAFVRGYLDADGSRNTNYGVDDNLSNNKFCGIQSSSIEHIDFIRKCFPIAGVYITSEKDLTGQETNFGIRPETVNFRIFTTTDNKKRVINPFVVKSIGTEEESVFADVWCLEVEDDHSFVLPFGLVTGNCAVRHIDSIRSFAESFFCLLCGNGVGFGLSRRFLDRLPNLVSAEDKTGTVITYVIEDTIEGWADSVEALLGCYFKNTAYTGRKIVFDYSKIRKKGAPLKTGGGKAPGYKGLKAAHLKIKTLLDYIIEERKQNKIRSIDAYDILMHCADAVLSGGVRRSACSVIFDKDDNDMMTAKTFFTVEKKQKFAHDEETNIYNGNVIVSGKKYHVEMNEYDYNMLKEKNQISWSYIEPQRARSNNSILLMRNNVTRQEFADIIKHTKEFGEPGFVFADHLDTLYNPCFEVSFQPITSDGVCGVQFCNLTSINGAKVKTIQDYLDCVKAATIIGTIQATYTDFHYLSNASKELTEEEALLGVSITGMMDSPEILLNPENQRIAAQFSKDVNKEWAEKLGINPAARITVVKPEGTSSLVLGCGSGIHAHHSKNYIRRVQCNKMDNVYRHFKKTNPKVCEESQWSANKTDDVVSFPVTINENAMVKSELSAIKHLNIIKSTQQNWVNTGTTSFNKKPITHNVSCTVIVKDSEWEEVITYLYENRNFFSAVSLLPDFGDKIYKQAPLEKMETPEEIIAFNELKENFKHVDFTKMVESDDETAPQQEAVCSGGQCEIVRV